MSKVKTPPKSAKYQQILQQAKRLFWKHGITRVTVTEICQEAGASKMTFYRFFENKINLAKKVLDDYYDEGVMKYRAIMKQDIPYPEKVKQVVLLKFEESQDISYELIEDILKNDDPELKQYLESRRKAGMQEFLADFQTAQKQGWIRPEVKLGFILYFIQKMHEMSLDPALASLYPNPQNLAVEMTNLLFYGILTRD